MFLSSWLSFHQKPAAEVVGVEVLGRRSGVGSACEGLELGAQPLSLQALEMCGVSWIRLGGAGLKQLGALLHEESIGFGLYAMILPQVVERHNWSMLCLSF